MWSEIREKLLGCRTERTNWIPLHVRCVVKFQDNLWLHSLIIRREELIFSGLVSVVFHCLKAMGNSCSPALSESKHQQQENEQTNRQTDVTTQKCSLNSGTRTEAVNKRRAVQLLLRILP